MANLKTGVLAALAVALSVLGIYTMHLRTNIAELRAQNASYMAANDEYRMAVDQQNRAVADLKAQADARAEAAKQAVDAAKAEARDNLTRAAKIGAVQPIGDDCAATKALLDDYFRVGAK